MRLGWIHLHCKTNGHAFRCEARLRQLIPPPSGKLSRRLRRPACGRLLCSTRTSGVINEHSSICRRSAFSQTRPRTVHHLATIKAGRCISKPYAAASGEFWQRNIFPQPAPQSINHYRARIFREFAAICCTASAEIPMCAHDANSQPQISESSAVGRRKRVIAPVPGGARASANDPPSASGDLPRLLWGRALSAM